MMRFCSVILVATCLFLGMALSLSAQESPTRFVMEEPREEVKITLSENRLVIQNLPKDDVLEIFNIMGKKVYARRVKAGANEYVLSLPKGYYILKIGNLTKKIAIR